MKDYLLKLVKDKVFPGCNYAVIADDIEIDSVGNKSLIPNIEPNNTDTLYDLASLTKVVVTNTLITKLLQENKINLNDKVKKYLPDFKHEDITIFHLLTHSSGLPADIDWKECNNRQELIKSLYDKNLIYKTGEDVIYSDLGFIFLGFIIEKIYNKSLDVIASEEIFKPLNMNDTSFNPKDKDRCAPTEITSDRGVVRGFVHDEKAYILGGICGAAGLFSTVSDLVKFTNMILNDGKIGDKIFIEKQYIDLWFQPIVIGKQGNIRSIGWCMGKDSMAGNLCSDNTIYHAGFTGNTLVIDRDNKIGFVFLSNRVHPTRDNKLLITERKNISNYLFNAILYSNIKNQKNK